MRTKFSVWTARGTSKDLSFVGNDAAFQDTSFPSTPQITTTVLPSGTSGTAYSQQITEVGGVAPFSWDVSSGTPPTGLTLSSGGVLSGTPSAGGSYAFTSRITDSWYPAQQATEPYSVNIATPIPVYIFTANYADGTITKLDQNGTRAGSDTSTGIPYTGAVASDGTLLWVCSNNNDSTVKAYNVTTMALVHSYPTGHNCSDICILPGGFIGIANRTTHWFTKLNASSGAYADYGQNPPYDCDGICSDGTRVWLGEFNSVGCSVFNITDGSYVTRVTGFPQYAGKGCYDGTNIWIPFTEYTGSNGGFRKYTASTQAYIGTYFDPGHHYGGSTSCYDSVNHYVCLANWDNTISQFDAATGAFVRNVPTTVPVGGMNNNGIAFDGTYLWISFVNYYQVAKVDSATGTIIGYYTVGNAPLGLCTSLQITP
jgi:hypothetical protein